MFVSLYQSVHKEQFEGVSMFLLSNLAKAAHIVILIIVACCSLYQRSVFDIRGNFEGL